MPIKSKKRSLIFRCTQYRHFVVGNASYNEVSGPSAGSGSSSSEVGAGPPWRAFVRHGHKPTLCAVLTFFSWHPTLIAHAVHIEYINSCGTLFFTRRMLLGNNSNQEKRIHQYYAQSNKKHNAICHLSVFVLWLWQIPKWLWAKVLRKCPLTRFP